MELLSSIIFFFFYSHKRILDFGLLWNEGLTLVTHLIFRFTLRKPVFEASSVLLA